MGVAARVCAFGVLAIRLGLAFGVVLLLAGVLLPGTRTWGGRALAALAGGAGFGLVLGTIDYLRVRHPRYASFPWRDRVRIRRDGAFTVSASRVETRSRCLDHLRRELGTNVTVRTFDDEPDFAEYRIGNDGWHLGIRVRARFLPGPRGSTHVCYDVRPRGFLLMAGPTLEVERILLSVR